MNESVSSASTIIKRAPMGQASMAYSQALTTVTAISKKSTHALEPDSILAGPSTAHGTLKSRAKMDMINKSRGSGIGSRSGIYSTIGRNAVMPEETELAKSSRSLAKSQQSGRPGSMPGSHPGSHPSSHLTKSNAPKGIIQFTLSTLLIVY